MAAPGPERPSPRRCQAQVSSLDAAPPEVLAVHLVTDKLVHHSLLHARFNKYWQGAL